MKHHYTVDSNGVVLTPEEAREVSHRQMGWGTRQAVEELKELLEKKKKEQKGV